MPTPITAQPAVAPASGTRFSVEDMLGRVLMILWFGIAVRGLLFKLFEYVAGGAPVPPLELTKSLLLLIFSGLAVGLTILRRPSKAVASGIEPRLTALAGTYLMITIPLLPTADLSPALSGLAIAIMVAGIASSTYCLYWLGRSYSIMATARKLVTAGPYRNVRHPLYACETLTLIGVVLANLSPWSVLIGVACVALLYRRMINEETVLRAAFPEYGEYARRVPRIVPRWPGQTQIAAR